MGLNIGTVGSHGHLVNRFPPIAPRHANELECGIIRRDPIAKLGDDWVGLLYEVRDAMTLENLFVQVRDALYLQRGKHGACVIMDRDRIGMAVERSLRRRFLLRSARRVIEDDFKAVSVWHFS